MNPGLRESLYWGTKSTSYRGIARGPAGRGADLEVGVPVSARHEADLEVGFVSGSMYMTPEEDE